jgi:hypothetical protein
LTLAFAGLGGFILAFFLKQDLTLKHLEGEPVSQNVRISATK